MADEGANRLAGKVKWFDAQRGWGFIQPHDGSDDVFVHQQCLSMDGFRSLNDEEEVEYEIETDSNRRKRAVRVTGPGGVELKGSSRPRFRDGPFQSSSRGGGRHERGGDRSYPSERGEARRGGRYQSRYETGGAEEAGGRYGGRDEEHWRRPSVDKEY